ncbi:MAG TPA: sigma-70 family RNA polymerase sigma factor [Armatimonadetes bacterium]|nr:sigma-70 family RNA polymerase sigma factor [Armatimonadota bacterium]
MVRELAPAQDEGFRGEAKARDAALVQRALEGDTTAFDLLFYRYQDRVYTLCLGLLDDPEDARDAAQETFVHAYRGLRGFRGRAAFATWLYRIAVNTAHSFARRQRREARVRETMKMSAGDNPVEAHLTHLLRRERIQAVLRDLPPAHREVLVLKYYQDLSCEEIGAVLGTSMNAVKVRLHRARQAFYRRYQELFGDEDEDL